MPKIHALSAPAPGREPAVRVAEIFDFEARTEGGAPLYLSPVAAGFPSPADDFIDKSLDLNEHLVSHPAATFFVRAQGESMSGAGIASGDLLVVDRALEPKSGDVIIAAVGGELTVKRIRLRGGAVWLVPENPAFPALKVEDAMDFEVWGVVTYVVHRI